MPPALAAARFVAAAYLVVLMFSMGLLLGGRAPADKKSKRHQRRLLLRGLAFNLIVLPLVAVVLTRSFAASGDVTIAFLLLVAAAGGRFAPHLSRIAGADLDLSVETTLFLAKTVALTAPITARWTLHVHRIELHELTVIAQLLGLQLAPYLAGRLLRRRWPKLAERLHRPLLLASWICLGLVLALVVLGHGLRGIAHLPSDRGWGAVLLFAVISLLLGWLLGGPEVATRRALAISADARDLALALTMASLAFSDRNVQLAVIAVWLVLLLVDLGYAELTSSTDARRRRRSPRDAWYGAPRPHS